MIGERAKQVVKSIAVLTVLGIVCGALAVAYVLRPREDEESVW